MLIFANIKEIVMQLPLLLLKDVNERRRTNLSAFLLLNAQRVLCVLWLFCVSSRWNYFFRVNKKVYRLLCNDVKICII